MPQYDLPYSGLVSVGGGGARSDSFAPTGPQLVQAGVPVPGYTALDPAWVTGATVEEPNIFQFAAVNARLGMAELQARIGPYYPSAAWFQRPLPPLVPDVENEFHLYGRTLLGSIKPQLYVEEGFPTHMDHFDAVIHGMWIGQAGGPLGPGFASGWLLGQSYGFGVDGAYPVLETGIWEVDEYGKLYKFTIIPGAAMPYYRARVRQKLLLDGTVSQTLGLEVSSSGVDWFSLELWTQEGMPPEYAIQAYGCYVFGETSGAVVTDDMYISAYADFLRYEPQPFDDRGSTVGGSQYLGAP
jgi:hypothetical protein